MPPSKPTASSTALMLMDRGSSSLSHLQASSGAWQLRCHRRWLAARPANANSMQHMRSAQVELLHQNPGTPPLKSRHLSTPSPVNSKLELLAAKGARPAKVAPSTRALVTRHDRTLGPKAFSRGSWQLFTQLYDYEVPASTSGSPQMRHRHC